MSFGIFKGSKGPDALPKETIVPLGFKHLIEPGKVFLPTPS